MARESHFPKDNKKVCIAGADSARQGSIVTHYTLTPEEIEKLYGPKEPAQPGHRSTWPTAKPPLRKCGDEMIGPEEDQVLSEIFPDEDYEDPEWGGHFDEPDLEDDIIAGGEDL